MSVSSMKCATGRPSAAAIFISTAIDGVIVLRSTL